MANRRIRVWGGRDLEKWVSEYQGGGGELSVYACFGAV